MSLPSPLEVRFCNKPPLPPRSIKPPLPSGWCKWLFSNIFLSFSHFVVFLCIERWSLISSTIAEVGYEWRCICRSVPYVFLWSYMKSIPHNFVQAEAHTPSVKVITVFLIFAIEYSNLHSWNKPSIEQVKFQPWWISGFSHVYTPFQLGAQCSVSIVLRVLL